VQNAVEKVKQLALQCGFSHAAKLQVSTIRVREEVRAMCAVNKCRQYGANWACPPACGTLEECDAIMRQFSWGVLVQTTGRLADTLDYEGMEAAGKAHGEYLEIFAAEILKSSPRRLVLGAGACRRCPVCAYPDEPCRMPGRMIMPMEGFGIEVSALCAANGLGYYYGPGTLTYTGCALLELF
jgi:predicted metal-binding protein